MHGPVPVIGQVAGTINGLGNGFATSAVQDTTGRMADLPDYGITDFVLYHSGQNRGNIDLYHFTGNVNTQSLASFPNVPTLPYNPMLPENATSDSQGAYQIQFDVDMAQLFPNLSSTQDKIAAGKLVNYLQVNIVATNVTPIDPTTNVNKEVDSMGNTLDPSAQQSFLQIDMRQSRTYSSEDVSSTLNEPVGNDVYPPGGNATSSLNLKSWRIDVQPGS